MSGKVNFFHKNSTINLRGKLFSFETPKVMGILNVTPDSFYDGGKYAVADEAMKRVNKMIEEGADIIDVGGYSTRPGAKEISEKEELERVIAVVRKIFENHPDTPVSIDTFRAKVAKEAIEAGAVIINDISGGSFEPEIIDVAVEYDIPYILMHIQGKPENMQQNPVYENVTLDVFKYFKEKIDSYRAKGLKDIIIDPGFGFGKTLEHNYQLLNELDYFKSLGCNLLAGVSRKSMLCKALHAKPENMLNATTWANTIALQKGADIIRVHDVKEAKELVMLGGFLK